MNNRYKDIFLLQLHSEPRFPSGKARDVVSCCSSIVKILTVNVNDHVNKALSTTATKQCLSVCSLMTRISTIVYIDAKNY